jgi:hypothetical protein
MIPADFPRSGKELKLSREENWPPTKNEFMISVLKHSARMQFEDLQFSRRGIIQMKRAPPGKFYCFRGGGLESTFSPFNSGKFYWAFFAVKTFPLG